MPLSNTQTRYGNVAKTFHWLTALLIVTLIPTGIIANGMPYDTPDQLAQKAQLFSIHKTLGVFVFFVAVARILWANAQPKPAPLHPERKVETFAAATAHWLLYGSLLLVPLSGWVHHAATEGFAPILWPLGQDLPLVPNSTRLADITASLHIIFERVLVFSLFLHVAGALKHHFVDKDVTLKRMWFGEAGGGSDGTHGRAGPSLTAAFGVWAIALAIGAWLGLFKPHDASAIAVPTLDTVDSQWTVQSGTLNIEVTQFGSKITGYFADWTAAINFDEQTGTGDVDVTIAIPSLTLGSVTQNALGPDYFAAEQFPTARFVADITPSADAYVATGTLTIRDAEAPVTLPFSLSIADQTATMTGALTLDRRDFGLGAADESTVGFAVGVSVDLTASRP